MNKCLLVGRLTDDPELRYTKSGRAVANFTLAVDRNYNSQEADFIDIVAWQKQAEAAAQYLKKGERAAVAGRLQIRKNQTEDGNTYINPEIVAREIDFLGQTPEKKTESAAANNPELEGVDLPF